MKYKLAIHGGAGTIKKKMLSEKEEQDYKNALSNALELGEGMLKKGMLALDVVEQVVKSLEDVPLFNAGRGSVFTHEGTHEMDASIMCGKTLRAGSVAAVRNIRNPITLSRRVLEKSGFVFLVGRGAEAYAKLEGIEMADDSYFFTDYRYNQWQELKGDNQVSLDHKESKKFGTVGAVALDIHGDLAAATSTGGLTNKRYGRVGDSPIIGAGNYANNNTCAVSCTGYGEYFIRSVVAYDISCLIEYANFSLEDACKKVVHEKLVTVGGEGGLIAIDKGGNIAMPFNTDGMYRASIGSEKSDFNIAIYR